MKERLISKQLLVAVEGTALITFKLVTEKERELLCVEYKSKIFV